MGKLKAPDAIVKDVLLGLATAEFDGIKATEFWGFVSNLCDGVQLDEFIKNIVWNWLLLEKDFQVMRPATKKEASKLQAHSKTKKNDSVLMVPDDKETLPDFQSFFSDENISDYKIKVTDDYQSLYLTGVLKKDNILGKMPYDLLRIIAKHKEKGINSIDLINEAKQDNRSLTARLQTLEDNLYIQKHAVISNRSSTNHMFHFRFIQQENDNDAIKSKNLDSHERLELVLALIQIMREDETKIRLTRDLYEEIVQIHPNMKARYFSSAVRFLVEREYLQLVKVRDGNSKKQFPALRVAKELPSVNNRNELREQIKMQKNDDDEINSVLADDFENSKYEQPMFNRFFPIVTQIYNLIEKNPGVTASVIASKLTGAYHAKQINTHLESITTVHPIPQNERAVIGHLNYSGKERYYRFTIQHLLNRRDPAYRSMVPEKETVTPLSCSSTLFEESIKYGAVAPVERHLKVLSFVNGDSEKLVFIPRGYPGKMGMKMTHNGLSKALYPQEVESQNGWIRLSVKGKVCKTLKKDIAPYKKINEAFKKIVEDYNKRINQQHEINLAIDPNFMEKSSVKNVKPPFFSRGDSAEPNIGSMNGEKESQKMDYGPVFRRKKLLDVVDKRKVVGISAEFCSYISELMKLDYKIDRRTLVRDALELEKKNQVECEQQTHGNLKRFLIKSVKNKPTVEDVNQLMGELSNSNREYRPRIFQDQVLANDASVKSKYLTDLINSAQELRLKKAKKKLQQTIERPNLSRKAKIIGAKRLLTVLDDTDIMEDQSDEEYDEQNQGKALKEESESKPLRGRLKDDNEDILTPLMDKRKRKKFKSSNKYQSRVVKAFKKIRSSIKITNDHILILIKAIVVTQSLSIGGNIDWPKVAKVLDDLYDPDMLRRQWPKYRKMLGPKNLMLAKKNWEKALLKAVGDGLITCQDLDKYDIFRMLDIWKSEGAGIFLDNSEHNILANYEENFKNHCFKPLKSSIDSSIIKETTTLIEREHEWLTRNFMYSVNNVEEQEIYNESIYPTDLQVAKTKLKALFSTSSDKFDSNKVRDLFAGIPKELYSQALTELEDMKAIAFLGEDSKIKFMLTERFLIQMDCKLEDSFIPSSNRMVEVLKDTNQLNNGLLLSPKCPNGAYVPIFSFYAEGNLKVIRVDQEMTNLETYSTKALDRSKLESDFILSGINEDAITHAKIIPPPMGKPCSLLWIDINGDFNHKLWRKCLYLLLWRIVINPGIPLKVLYFRVYPMLEVFEVRKILEWLIQRKNIMEGEFGGYWPTECWYDVL